MRRREVMRHSTRSLVALGCAAAFASGVQAQQTVTLKMQATWPSSLTLYDNFTFFADRVSKISGGTLKIDAMPAGQVVPAFEVLDATHKKVLDGAHSWSGYWVGKNKTAILMTGGPGGTFGMDMIDALGWMQNGGGLELAQEFFQKELKLNIQWFPILPSGPQAFGWFKRPIKNLADFKGMKCRQTGMAAEVFQRMGMQTVNMPGGEIIPSAQRGERDLPHLVGEVAAPERRRHQGAAGEARRTHPAHAAGDSDRVPQDLGRDRRGGRQEESLLQEDARFAARLRGAGGAGEALHVPAVFVRRELLLARGHWRQAGHREGGERGQEEIAA